MGAMVTQALALLRPTSGTQRFESAPPAGGQRVNPPTSSDAAPSRPDTLARILVVDDQEGMRWLARRILEDCGCEVLTVSDGAAALGALQFAMLQPGSAIDLVLTDIDMPGGDGYALGRELAARWPALPVVYMSAGARSPGRRAQLAPSEPFLEKPFSADRLLMTIHLVLQGGAHRRQARTGYEREKTT